LAGSFIGLTYQTNNFLGLGETLTFSANFGDLSRSFRFSDSPSPISLTAPISFWFHDFFPAVTSLTRRAQAALYTGQAVSINPQFHPELQSGQHRLHRFLPAIPFASSPLPVSGLQYGLTRTNITAFNDASKLLFTQVQFRSIAGPSALNGIISSTITPSITYNTVNNPINPTGGKKLLLFNGFFSGLGGNVKSVSNVF